MKLFSQLERLGIEVALVEDYRIGRVNILLIPRKK